MERITVVFVVGMLCSGAVNILTKKAQNDVDSLDSSGEVVPFTHPWFQTFVMVRLVFSLKKSLAFAHLHA